VIEDTLPGVKSKTNTKFIERIAKHPTGEKLSEKGKAKEWLKSRR
jgi:hypothetical protein